jgi:membrane protease YdiL (CAAX protease family)
VLACTWGALLAADWVVSKQFPESQWITRALLPALAVETACYLASVFAQTRNWIALFRPARAQAALLCLSAVLPYLIFSLSAGTFHRNAFYLLVGLTAVFSFWHAVLPRRPAYDFGFLVIAAAPFINRVFSRIYLSPDAHVRADILGHLMWIRVGIVALLVLREWEPGAFSLWPKAREWRSGAIYYGAALIPVVALALAVHDVRWAPLSGAWWKVGGTAAGTFFGFLFVTALAEELFFRGVIARALLDNLPSQALAVLLSAAVYGAAHLWFRGFPDWRRAVVAALLGVFCGFAYARTQSVRVSMVTHTLVVATWRLFFK